ncbi:MAG TPA: glycosyltransferase family 39 protein [Pelolinea sp.]|nr:glycosyltransferase family 39 protein [Pelolinea sp.]
MNKILKKLASHPFFYRALLGCILVIFLILAFSYAHQLPSRVDEGSFLIKGYYYINGRYQPFEDYGPWTNNMPLSYYLPGLAQYLFGPGLRTGRYFAIFLMALTMTALWLLLYRLKGKWWALFGILPIAINPALIVMYVQALSQGIVACLLSWALFFLIGEKRKEWQIAAGAFLGAMAILTRQNMIFLLPFVVIYAFWLHGRRAGWLALVISGLPLVIAHWFFFPDIFKLWFAWLPGSILNFFNFQVLEGGGTQVWKPQVELFPRITSFFTTVRYHFLALTGIFTALIALPRKKFWKSPFEHNLVFLLTSLFILFFGLHAWASLTKNYCVYCFSSYVSFFLPLAVVPGVISISNIINSREKFSAIPFFIYGLVFIPGVFLGSLETVGRWVMSLPFPRVKDGRILSGTTELWKIFENRFGSEYDQLIRLIPPAFGFVIAILTLLFIGAIYHFLKKKLPLSFGIFLPVSFLTLGVIFTPTYLLGRDNIGNQCGGDVLAAYESVGQQFRAVIPPGSKVYWGAGSVVTPLIYLTDTEIHPPQLNGIYSKRRGGDRDLLEKSGFYNEDSVNAWLLEDDYFLVGNINMGDFWQNFFDPELFNEYLPTTPLDPCDANSTIRIFKRK